MSGRATVVGRLTRGVSRIGVRLLLFNVLLVFLPVAGLASLDAYEQHLLDQQERAMVQHARLLASALAEGAALDEGAQRVLDRLERSSDARLRVIAPDGRVLADSHRAAGPEPAVEGAYRPQGRVSQALRTSIVYRAGAWLGRVWRRVMTAGSREPSADPITTSAGIIRAPEVAQALAGGYGAATRLSTGGQRSVTLYGALPIRKAHTTIGAVLVSQSTWRILQRLYDVRLRMFEVVIVSLMAAAVLGIITSTTIVRPLAHLRDDARALVDRRGRPTRRFRGTARRDEIGDLARALEEVTARLDAHLRFTEQFAADVSHEFRNPLASIRASSDMLAEAERAEDRERFRSRIDREIGRLEALLARVREITRMDAGLEGEPLETIDLSALVRDLIAGRADARPSRPPVIVHASGGPLMLRASPERIVQVVTNLVDNAESFSPEGARVHVDLTRDEGLAILSVRDEGPGIPAPHVDRVFERFFTHRPDDPRARETHAGLGLSIAKTIVEAYGGTIRASNPGRGAQFEVRLPLGG